MISKLNLLRVFSMMLFSVMSFNANGLSDRARGALAHQRNAPVDSSGAVMANNPKHEAEFRHFWRGFREAVINSNWVVLGAFTRFPLQTRGSSDYDPIIEIAKSDFKEIFSLFLEEEESLIRELDEVNPYITDDWARIGGMQFTRMEGSWFLYWVYLDLEDASE